MHAVHAFDGFRAAYRSWFGKPGQITDTDYVIAQYDGEIRYNSDHLAMSFLVADIKPKILKEIEDIWRVPAGYHRIFGKYRCRIV